MDPQELRKQAIKDRLKEMHSLPALPPIVSKLNTMMEDENVTAHQLGALIERDQVLTGKLLKMVNSSFYGFPQRISTVSNAIVLLGFNVIRTLIVTSSIFEFMQSSDIGLWEHSLGCATAAGILARRMGIKNPEEISTAGLIHDLGKIVIRSELPAEYQQVQDIVAKRQIPMREAELIHVGLAHGEIGGWLAAQWNLPERLVEPIRHHHNPEETPTFKEPAAIVHFSDILIRAVGYGSGGDPWVPPLDHNAWSRIKFGKAQTQEVLRELDEKLTELQDFTMEIHQMSTPGK